MSLHFSECEHNFAIFYVKRNTGPRNPKNSGQIMKFSALATRLQNNPGIRGLMEDLGAVSSRKNVFRFGGGNPAHIPEAEEIFFESFQKLNHKSSLSHLLGDYQAPIGNDGIRELTAEYLSPLLGASLKKENIAFFNGSQNAFSFLLNLFSGKMQEGDSKKILLPLVPEYIGYADQTLEPNSFLANLPIVQKTKPNRFRYKMNTENFSLKTVGAVLLSSPTNPTGNILPEEDLDFLDIQTKKFEIPLLIDLAYGAPFPKITGQSPPVFYKEGRTLSLSFSKVGLPGVRLGIIISSSEIISHLSAFASMGNLAVGNLGIFLAEIFFQEDTLVQLSQNTLRPYYEKKQKTALEMFESEFQKYSVNYEIHEPLGGFFLWVRFPGLSIRNDELYEVCKKKNLYFVSGHFFFPGLNQEFSHTWECIRLTYNVGEEELAHGARLLAEIVAFHQAKS